MLNELLSDGSDLSDFVELYNPGASTLSLAGYALIDDPSGTSEPYVFPSDAQIPARGRVVVWCDDGEGDEPGGHALFKLSKDGEQVRLLDPSGGLVEAVDLPALDEDTTWARLPDGGAWATSEEPSPGEANR